jgi:hypothetical protein
MKAKGVGKCLWFWDVDKDERMRERCECDSGEGHGCLLYRWDLIRRAPHFRDCPISIIRQLTANNWWLQPTA